MNIGVDIGGTKFKTGLVDSTGKILISEKQPTGKTKGSRQILKNVISAINQCLKKSDKKPDSIGVGIAGQVEAETGKLIYGPNLNWKEVPVGNILKEKFELPVYVVNDVTAATAAEWQYGAGKNTDDLVCIFVGTGVGGGVVSGGRILIGCSNTAGELGHITIVVDGRKCRCSNRGCLEAYAGGWAIAKRAREAVKKNKMKGKNMLHIAGDMENITAKTVSEAFNSGDELASELVRETGHYLGSGIVGLINSFNPCKLILGGGVIHGIPVLIDMVREEVKNNAFNAATEPLEITEANFIDDAAVIGAAFLAEKKAI